MADSAWFNGLGSFAERISVEDTLRLINAVSDHVRELQRFCDNHPGSTAADIHILTKNRVRWAVNRFLERDASADMVNALRDEHGNLYQFSTVLVEHLTASVSEYVVKGTPTKVEIDTNELLGL